MNCYILIGGRSTRMGRSKVPLFLDRVLAAVRPVFDPVIAVQRPGGESVAIETIYERPHEHEAPAFGVARALEHAGADCFILAVDYPLVTADVLRYIESRFRKGDAALVAPRWNDKVQMLCAAYAHSLQSVLEERLAAGRFDLRGLAGRAEILDETELRTRFAGEPLLNVNTVEDWERAKTLSSA